MFTGDITADYFDSYQIALFVLPFLFGVAIGSIGVCLLKGSFKSNIKKFWWLPTMGAVAAMLPVAFLMWVMSQPH